MAAAEAAVKSGRKDHGAGLMLAGNELSPHQEGKMRLKSHIWVSAYLRRLNSSFISAALVRRGDSDAGAIYIKVSRLDGTCQVYAPLSAHMTEVMPGDALILDEGRVWQPVYTPHAAETEADTYLAKQASRDPDIWILEVEMPEGKLLPGQNALALT
jgi:hypothetical protein